MPISDRDAAPPPRSAAPAGSAPASDSRPPTDAELAFRLLDAATVATLSTLAREPMGFPFGSLVALAATAAGPVLLLSDLAEHTRNLRSDSRASLLVAPSTEVPGAEPLAGPRVTLIGRCEPVPGAQRELAREAYLVRHPSAAALESFRDFTFFRLEPSGVRFVGGFGRMSWVSIEDWRTASADPLAPHAAGILAHMNEDHADALIQYCRAFTALGDVASASMTGIDRFGFELRATTAAGARSARIGFATPIASRVEARQALVALLATARAKLGAG